MNRNNNNNKDNNNNNYYYYYCIAMKRVGLPMVDKPPLQK